MTEELKPCPFCGGKAEFENDNGEWFVFCEKCGSMTVLFETKPEAKEAWNTRQIEYAQAAEIKRLREALEIYKEALHEGLWKTGLQDSIWEVIEQAEEKAEQILKGEETEK